MVSCWQGHKALHYIRYMFWQSALVVYICLHSLPLVSRGRCKEQGTEAYCSSNTSYTAFVCFCAEAHKSIGHHDFDPFAEVPAS